MRRDSWRDRSDSPPVASRGVTAGTHIPGDLIVPLPPDAAARQRSRTGDAYRGHDYAGKRWREEDLPAPSTGGAAVGAGAALRRLLAAGSSATSARRSRVTRSATTAAMVGKARWGGDQLGPEREGALRSVGQ
jgi:hypothetical protein